MISMKKYDVIIIGAGPAGSYAAYMLAKSKIKVLVIDKYSFPRYKPCAGGLTAKAFNSFDFPISKEVKYSTNTVVTSYKNQIFHNISGNKILVKMVERKEFDDFLIKKAIDSGATFLDGMKVTEVTWENAEFCIKTDSEFFRCNYLIGADGTNSIVNRTFNIVERDLYGFAVEINCPVSKNNIGKFNMTFDFGTVPNGYLWIFPKDEYVCVGAYTTNKKMKNIQKYLIDYIEKLGLVPESENFKGHVIPHYGINYKQPDFPCILVGDAAGFGEYWTGEGIYYAVKSGTIAAEVISSSIKSGIFDHQALQRRYQKEIIQGLKLAYYIGKFFYGHLPLSFNLVMSYLPVSIMYESASRGLTFDQAFSKLPVVLSSLIQNKSHISNNKYHR
ncbi:Geranylgeranyl diphosphate reductase [Methanosarcina barkeri 227]|uniref:Geranylgeranyl diphosphate reductase n=4 Tax=Methanosarcina barkeri TaxID=2208 RepID=A0A0E3QW28_METBA|nr:Geranylgeranyl diphosphate reductase [Methanosarcina barkeri MS]AKB59310.1 Geranylgeranyl diphosphate reductase [Methanosarcina barkeri 227]AKJ39974.1 geranylgeranyl reductase family protein [Methanosarcina barkeri CM1]